AVAPARDPAIGFDVDGIPVLAKTRRESPDSCRSVGETKRRGGNGVRCHRESSRFGRGRAILPSFAARMAGSSGGGFLSLANRVWPRDYDVVRAADAIARTINIGAWDGGRLVGAVRVLSDGYLFSTVPEILVDPQYLRRVRFFERIGCTRGPVGFVLRKTA